MGEVVACTITPEVATRRELSELFAVTTKTITLWQKRKDDPLPTVQLCSITASVTRYPLDAVVRWAIRNKVRMACPRQSADSARKYLQDRAARLRTTYHLRKR